MGSTSRRGRPMIGRKGHWVSRWRRGLKTRSRLCHLKYMNDLCMRNPSACLKSIDINRYIAWHLWCQFCHWRLYWCHWHCWYCWWVSQKCHWCIDIALVWFLLKSQLHAPTSHLTKNFTVQIAFQPRSLL
jgi:hypothetical protein